MLSPYSPPLLDQMCKLLKNGWVCLLSKNVDLSISYSSPGRLANNMEDSINLCEQVNYDQDKIDLCKIEERFSTGIIQMLFSGYNLKENPIEKEEDRDDICHPTSRMVPLSDVTRQFCCSRDEVPYKEVLFTTVDKCDGAQSSFVDEEELNSNQEEQKQEEDFVEIELLNGLNSDSITGLLPDVLDMAKEILTIDGNFDFNSLFDNDDVDDDIDYEDPLPNNYTSPYEY